MRRSARLAKKQGNPEPQAPFCPYKLGLLDDSYHDERLRHNLPGQCKYCQPSQDETRITGEVGVSAPVEVDSEHISDYDMIRQKNIEERQRKFQELQLNEAKTSLYKSLNLSKKAKSCHKRATASKEQSNEPLRRSSRLQNIQINTEDPKPSTSADARTISEDLDHCVMFPNRSGGKCGVCEYCYSVMGAPIIEKASSSEDEDKPGPFGCQLCHKSFNTSGKRDRHFDEHVKETVEYYERKCSTCDKRFGHKRDLTRHVREVHEKKGRYKCNSCDLTFSRYVSMSRHNCQGFLHWREYCDSCEKSFSRKDHLARHKKQFHEGQKLKCPKCPAIYSQRSKLKKHVEKHHENTPDNSENDQDPNELGEGTSRGKVFCPICSKEFKWANERSRHIREVHSKDRRVKCPKCNQDFSRRETMERHCRRDHSNNVNNFSCDICDKQFNRKDNLTRHIKEVHENQKFECEECPAEFSQKVKLERHIKKGKHWVWGECHHCNETFDFKSRAAFHRHCWRDCPKKKKHQGIV